MKNWDKYLELTRERPTLFTAEELEIILDKDVVSKFEEETESISHVRLSSKEEVIQMIASGEITDGFTLSALAIWQLCKKN